MNVRHGRRRHATAGMPARVPRWTAALLAAALVLTPVGSHGQPASGAANRAAAGVVQDEGLGTALRYAGCALSIAFAATTAQIWFAALTCVTLLVESLE